MKKLFMVLPFVALGFTSCGEASGDEKKANGDSEKGMPSTVCDCVEMGNEEMKDMLKDMSDENLETKYGEKRKACTAMIEKLKSDAEREAINKEAENCSSFDERNILREQLMDKLIKDTREEASGNE